MDPVLAELLRQRPGQRDDRTLRGDVVQEERDAAERRAGGDVHDFAAVALSTHHGHRRSAGEEHGGDVHVHHLPPLLERDLGEWSHRERGVEAGVVDQDVEAPLAVERLVDHATDVVLVRDVGADAAFRRVEVGDDDDRALGGEAVGDCSADPLRPAGDNRHLALELLRHRSGENEVGIRIRFSWVWIRGWTLARKATQVWSAWSSARRRCRSA
jgi:hypothetical protein